MKAFFISTDFLSQGAELVLNGKKTEKNYVGALFSIATTMCVLFLVIFLGIDIIQKKKPYVIQSEEILPEVRFTNLTNFNYILGWKIVNEAGSFLDATGILTTSLINEIYKVKTDVKPNEFPFHIETKKFEFIPCKDYKNYEGEVLPGPLSTFLCPKDFNIEMGGYYNDAESAYLNIRVELCTNSTENGNSCQSREKIDEFFKTNPTTTLRVLYRDFSIDPKSPDKSVSFQNVPYSLAITRDLFNHVQFDFTNVELRSDNGILFEDFTTTKAIKLLRIDKEMTIIGKENKLLAVFSSYILRNNIRIERRYMKIQELTANVGGLFEFLRVAFSIILIRLNRKLINTNIMNELFDFEDFENRHKAIKNETFIRDNLKVGQKSIVSLIDNSVSINVRKLSDYNPIRIVKGMEVSRYNPENILLSDNPPLQQKEEEVNKNEDKNELKKVELHNNDEQKIKLALNSKKTQGKLSFTFLENVRHIFCAIKWNFLKSEIGIFKDKQYRTCEATVKDCLDLNRINRQLEELEYLKMIQLDKEEIMSFSYFSKPKISDDGKIPDRQLLINKGKQIDNKKQEIELISNYFANKLNQSNALEEKDIRMLELLEINM